MVESSAITISLLPVEDLGAGVSPKETGGFFQSRVLDGQI